ncbi:hypothetical protein L218DRAFT_1079067 [Marasmius fiardii PR-910]|nr:hypothetical protein L218DRAFT_1079067 [Marasmius fiardii PR-910]
MSTLTTDSMITPVSVTQSSTFTFDPSRPGHTKETPSLSDKDSEYYEQPLSLSFLHYKDQRAYEHDRQRQKQGRDFAQMCARKGRDYSSLSFRRVGWLPLPIPSYLGYRSASSPAPSGTKLGFGNHDTAHLEDFEQGYGEALHDEPKSFGNGKEAKLTDFVISVRKARKHRETDFEFIPHIRSVIVLDDIVQTKDVSVVDEPWEHIGDDEKLPNELTYANVVANTGPGSHQTL